MAASRDKRRKPEESEGEQQQVQRIRLRPRQHQHQQQQPLRKVVMRTVSVPPLSSRARPEPPKQLLPGQKGRRQEAPIRPHLQVSSKINPQRPKARRVRGTQVQQNSEPKEYRTQERATTQDKKLVSNPRVNPWAVNPQSKIEKFPASTHLKPGVNPQSYSTKAKATPTPPRVTPSLVKGGNGERSRETFALRKTGGDTENQHPKLIDVGPRRKGLSRTQIPRFELFKQLLDSRNRRRENKRSQVTTSVGTTSKRLTQPPRPQSSPTQKNQTSRSLQKRPLNPLVYIIRLLILGIGIGAIAGTLLSALEPTTQASVKTQDTVKTQVQDNKSGMSSLALLPMGREISPMKAKIQTLVGQYPQLQAGVFLVDLDTGAYLDGNSDSTFPSASTIKLPILVAFFQDVEAGKVRLDESLTLKPEMIAGGSGELRYKKPGTQYLAIEVAKKMITISDNTATNMLISRLGGVEALNQRFHSWGLTTTVLRNPLPDVEGTNTTSPRELANLMLMVNQGQLVSAPSRDRMLDILQQTQTNTMLPKGLGAGATIAHKTGTIGSLLADVGLVDMPTGKRYIISVMVKRPHDDSSAEQLIRQISRTAYDYFSQSYTTSPNTTSIPSGRSSTANRAIAPENSFN